MIRREMFTNAIPSVQLKAQVERAPQRTSELVLKLIHIDAELPPIEAKERTGGVGVAVGGGATERT